MVGQGYTLDPLLHACAALEAYSSLFSELFVFLRMGPDTPSIYFGHYTDYSIDHPDQQESQWHG